MVDVSVVMSVYNGGRYLRDSVESVLGQSFGDFEFLIVNDGSTDGSRDILAEYERQDGRIRVIDQENTGLTMALIRGCGEARGRYIARQDADDLSHHHRLAEQAALLERDPAVGFVSCWAQYIGPEGELLEKVTRPADPQEATRLLLDERQGPPAHGSVMFRASAYHELGGYRRQFYYAQDSDLWLRMAERVCIAYVPEVLYQYRREMDSVSGQYRPVQMEFGVLGQQCRAARRDGRCEEPYLKRAGDLAEQIRLDRRNGTSNGSRGTQMAYLIGSRLARQGDRRAARYLWQVLCHRPWHWRAWVRLVQSQATRRKPAEHV